MFFSSIRQLNIADKTRLIDFIFVLQQIQNFGDPFFLVIHDGETLADIKVRIQKKLQVPNEEFSKVTSHSLFETFFWSHRVPRFL